MTTPAPRPTLDRAALERVLARAAELQAQNTVDGSGALSDEQILDLGKEVGLSADALRRAMAEERSRVVQPQSPGPVDAWFGSATISAARVVPGNPASVLAALDDVMRGELSFDVKRRFPDRLQWIPRRGFLDVMKSQLSRGTEGADLRAAEEVSVLAVAVDAAMTHVRLDATVRDARARAAMTSSVALAGGVTLAWLGFVMGFALVATVGAGAAVGAYGLLSQRDRFRRRAARSATSLEQLLDRLEFGPAKRRDNIVDKLLRG